MAKQIHSIKAMEQLKPRATRYTKGIAFERGLGASRKCRKGWH